MKTLRNIFRNKGRAILTILGVTIGIFAIVVMGSLAERLNLLVSNAVKYYGAQIFVNDASSNPIGGSQPVSLSNEQAIATTPGVKAVFPSISLPLSTNQAPFSLSNPPTINSDIPSESKDAAIPFRYISGGPIKVGQRGVTVLGNTLAKQMNAKVGQTVVLRGKKFRVVGILDKTFTAPDNSAEIPFTDAQTMYAASLPSIYKGAINPSNLASGFTAYPASGANADKVANAITARVPGLRATPPTIFKQQVQNSLHLFELIILSSAGIAILVGGLSIINTMTIAITERKREIGIKKAIGASNKRILREIIAESALVGLIGGLVGLFLGWALVRAINAETVNSGQLIFLTTPRLAVGTVVFSVILGALGGVYPALYAARLHPIEALRGS